MMMWETSLGQAVAAPGRSRPFGCMSHGIADGDQTAEAPVRLFRDWIRSVR